MNSRSQICLALLLCMTWATATLHAVEGDVYALLDDLNLRQGPGSFYALNSIAAEGERAIELGSSGEWMKIRLSASGKVGWAYAPSLGLVSAASQKKVIVKVGSRVAVAAKKKDDSSQRTSLSVQEAVQTKLRSSDTKVAVAASNIPNLNIFESNQTKPKQIKPKQTEPKQAEQQMTPPIQSVEGEDVSPMFEDGAVSQKTVKPKQGKSTQPVVIAKAASHELKTKTNVAKLENVLPLKIQENVKTGVVKSGAILPVEFSTLPDKGEAAAQPMARTETGQENKANDPPEQKKISVPDTSRVADIKKTSTVATETVKKNTVDPVLDRTIMGRKTEFKKTPMLSENKSLHAVGKGVDSENSNLGDQVLMQTTVIRKGSSALSDVLGWAGKGAQVQALHQKGKWMKVRMLDSGRTGWIESASLVTSHPSKAATMLMPTLQNKPLQKAKAQTELAEPDSKTVATVVADAKPVETKEKTIIAKAGDNKSNRYTFNKKANLRAGPNVIFDTVSWAALGSQATELDHKGDWVRIQMQVSKRIGWVFHRSLDMMNAGAAVAGSSLAVVGAASSPKVVPVINAVVGSSTAKINKEAATASQTAPKVNKETATVSKATTDVYRLTKKANLRAGPAIKYDVVAWAGQGDDAVRLDRKGDWLRIQLQKDKRIGWVFHSSLQPVKTDSAMAKKAVEKEAVMSAIKPDQQLYFFKRTSTLRAGPGKRYDRVAWGGRNESAKAIDYQNEWTRVRMTISEKVGWVFNAYLVRAVDSGKIITAYRSPPSLQVAPTVPVSPTAQAGFIYQVLRTTTLHADANEFSELIASVGKGDSVVWLEENKGWVRVNPQLHGSKVGWIKASLLKRQKIQAVAHKPALINKRNLVNYKDRMSKGETFNFSYAALEEALYKVPVEDIHIRMDDDDLKALFLKRQYDKSTFDIRVKTGRHRLHGTVKVLGSSTRIFKKKSLLIKLDKESARWYGHRRIALRSMASDKALMREWMAWKMMAAMGMKVPEVHFTRVTFNHGEKTGLYLSIEWMGAEFLEANHLDSRGEFYQPDDGASCGDLYSFEEMQLCFNKITPQDDDYSNIKAMAVAVNAATNSNIDQVLAKYFDVDSVINWIAVNSLVTNGDTYNKNYWLYFHPSEKKWTMIPWDYNLTFGRSYDNYGMPAFRIFNDNFEYYYAPDVGAGNPIKDKILRNPKLRSRLEKSIKHLMGMEANGPEHTFGWFSPTVMHARIGNLATVVGKELYKDTFLSYDEADFTNTYESLMHYVTAHDHFLKTKLFGDLEWKPAPPNQPIVSMPLPNELIGRGHIATGAESSYMVDRSWGYFVARLDLHKPLKSKATFDVRVEGGRTPKMLPIGQSARRCIERSWVLQTKTPNVSVMGNVMFEYTQENSRRSEVPPTVHEDILELWMLDGNRWKPMQTEVNEYSNTLTAKHVRVKSGHTYRFVACSPF